MIESKIISDDLKSVKEFMNEKIKNGEHKLFTGDAREIKVVQILNLIQELEQLSVKYKDLKLENEVLEKRLRHLLQSETIKSFDEYKPFTREYNLDIKKLDEIFSSIFDYTSQDMKLWLLTNCCLEKLIKGIETGNIILEFK